MSDNREEQGNVESSDGDKPESTEVEIDVRRVGRAAPVPQLHLKDRRDPVAVARGEPARQEVSAFEQARTDYADAAYRPSGPTEVQCARDVYVLEDCPVLTGVATADDEIRVRHVGGADTRHRLEHAEDVLHSARRIAYLRGG